MKALLVAAVLLGAVAPAAGAQPAPAGPAGTHYLYLIRHGMYDRDSLADDRIGNGLNRLGREQAERIGARLAALPVRIDTLVSSDFTRARETADIIAAGLGRVAGRDPLIHECTPASDRADLMRREAAEDVARCDADLAAAWAKYAVPAGAADRHDVLVAHGNVIRWFVCRATGNATERWAGMDIANASLTVLAIRPDGRTRLVIFSDVGHLPVASQTWAGRGAGWGAAPAR